MFTCLLYRVIIHDLPPSCSIELLLLFFLTCFLGTHNPEIASVPRRVKYNFLYLVLDTLCLGPQYCITSSTFILRYILLFCGDGNLVPAVDTCCSYWDATNLLAVAF